MANVRIRGKIPREEWPKIAARFQNGETLTEIARSYHCTAPAIRYIVGRVSIRGGKAKMDRDKLEKVAVLPPPVPVAAPPGLDEPPVEDDVEPPVPAPVLPPEPVVPPPVSLPHPMIPTVEAAPVTTKT